MTLEHKAVSLPPVSTDIEMPNGGGNFLAALMQENPTLYADIQRDRTAQWRRQVRDFEQAPDDFYAAWHYLDRHPLFWYFAGTKDRPAPFNEKHIQTEGGLAEGLDILVVKVDPKTGNASPLDKENTKTRIWYEVCFTHWPAQHDDPRTHVWQCDGGGDTYEEAIIKAARQIHEQYGNDRRIFDEERAGEHG